MSKCYANPDPTFLPALRLIASITQSSPATVTTTFAHNYTTGVSVRIHIPVVCGMRELADFVGEVTVTGANTFTIAVDTTNFEPFAIPAVPVPAWADTCASVVPIGENNGMLSEATRNVLP